MSEQETVQVSSQDVDSASSEVEQQELAKKKKKPSAKLLDLIYQLTEGFANTKEVIGQIKQQAKIDGVSNIELRALITEACKKRGLSERQILRYLADDLKDPKKRAAGKKKKPADTMSAETTEKISNMLGVKDFLKTLKTLREEKKLEYEITNGRQSTKIMIEVPNETKTK